MIRSSVFLGTHLVRTIAVLFDRGEFLPQFVYQLFLSGQTSFLFRERIAQLVFSSQKLLPLIGIQSRGDGRSGRRYSPTRIPERVQEVGRRCAAGHAGRQTRTGKRSQCRARSFSSHTRYGPRRIPASEQHSDLVLGGPVALLDLAPRSPDADFA